MKCFETIVSTQTERCDKEAIVWPVNWLMNGANESYSDNLTEAEPMLRKDCLRPGNKEEKV